MAKQRCTGWRLALVGMALASSACAPISTQSTVAAPPPSTYTLSTTLGTPVVMSTSQADPSAGAPPARSAPFQMSVGYGSAAFRDPKDAPGVIWVATDRGPNIDCEDTAGHPVRVKNFCGRLKGKIFPDPGFNPSIYQVRLVDGGNSNRVEVLKTIPLRDAAGRPVTGLPNDYPDRARDLDDPSSAAVEANTEYAYDRELQRLPFNQNGLDVEALVRLPDGSFWLAEEYAPSLVRVSPDGVVLERIVPDDREARHPATGRSMSVCDALTRGTNSTTAATYPVRCALPGILAMRSLNRGFENLAVSADGKTLYVAMQSPLANPSKAVYRRSRNVRLLTVALKADGGFERVSGEYVYSLDAPESFPLDQSNKQHDVKLSELAMSPDGRLIQLERINRQTKLYVVDLGGATNILGSRWDSIATQPSLEALTDLAAAGITPLRKTLVFDTARDAPHATDPGKVEGLAFFAPDHFALVTDNDFGIVSQPTYFYVIRHALSGR
jgi:hypothetical protein